MLEEFKSMMKGRIAFIYGVFAICLAILFQASVARAGDTSASQADRAALQAISENCSGLYNLDCLNRALAADSPLGAATQALVDRACAVGDIVGCTLGAVMYASGRGTKRNVEKFAAYAEKACEAEIRARSGGVGCSILVRFSNKTVDQKIAALTHYCETGLPAACVRLNSYLLSVKQNELDNPDLLASASRVKKMCYEGDNSACSSHLAASMDGGASAETLNQDKPHADRACAAGFLDACVLVIAFQENSTTMASLSADSLERLKNLCAQENILACRMIAGFSGASGDAPIAFKYWLKVCSLEYAFHCTSMGHFLHKKGKLEGKPNAMRASILYREGCRRGEDDSCLLSMALSSKDGVRFEGSKRPPAELEGKCGLGNPKRKSDPVACNALGLIYSNGTGVEQDIALAARMFDAACMGGNPRGCTNLGKAYFEGGGVVEDYQAAGRLFERACQDGDKKACSNLGKLLLDGLGRPVDEARAVALFNEACEAKDELGCAILGGAFLLHGAGSKDFERGLALTRRACLRAIATACHNLAVVHRDGDGLAEDPILALDLFSRACAAGLEQACADAVPLLPGPMTFVLPSAPEKLQ
ncbi:MAG: hypothetical protein ACKVH0_14250 [Alphaproteobacteria bacterium]